MTHSSDRPERPRAEPEIIPPDRRPPWPSDDTFSQARSTHRVYVGRISPLGFGLMLLIVGLFAGVLLLLLIGAALIWIPLVVAIALGAAISGLLRRR